MSEPSHPETQGPAPAPDRRALPRGVPDPVLAEYEALAAVALTDAERWPLLDDHGFARLHALRDHPHAPDWVHVCGDRVLPEDVPLLAECSEAAAERRWEAHGDRWARPVWVDELVARLATTVPRYRSLARRDGRLPRSLEDVAPVSRDHLLRGVADFVPVDVPLDRVFEGSSSGSTGAALVVPLHPLSTAAEVGYLTDLAARAGVRWEAHPDRTALLNVVDQRTAFTYASALTTKGGAPMARVNVHPDGWRSPGDREAFLADADAQVLSGNPLSLLALADLDVDLRPLVVFSGASHLTPAARLRLTQRWGAPVVDVYGTREAGLVAADLDGHPDARGQTRHTVLPRRLHVEILDTHGTPVPDGTRGDVVVTVDDNPYLPLLRYRTGDTAALVRERGDDGTWSTVLLGLEGRASVRFRAADGRWVPSVDTTQLLQAHGLAAWHLHQRADGTVTLTALPATPSTSIASSAPRPVSPTGAGSPGTSTSGARVTVAHSASPDPLTALGTALTALGTALTALLGRAVEITVVADPRDLGPGSKRRFSSMLDA